MHIRNICHLGTITAVCLLLASCGGSGSDSDDNGQLSLSITDAPIYLAQLVEIDVIGVEVKPESGAALVFKVCEDPDDSNEVIIQEGDCTVGPGERTIDLLQYTNGASFKLLNGVILPAGRVNWVRLMLKDPAGRFQLPAGGTEPLALTVPSGNQTGLKLNRGFDIVADEETRVTIDFDVRKSIVEAPPGEFKLKPVLRLVEEYGAIAGTVDAALLLVPECLGPSIYVFEGTTTPDDIDRDKGDPVSSAMVSATPNPDGTNYRVDFLEPGEYTAAFICAEGGPAAEPEDNPDLDDEVSFTPPAGKPATVIDEQTFTLDLP